MKREEIEKAINNGESVWVVTNEPEILDFKKINKRDIHLEDGQLEIDTYYGELSSDIYQFEEVFKTKAEALHYLHHANITRTETLPFLTWEEFKEQKQFTFIGRSSLLYRMRIEQFDDKYLIFLEHYFMESFNVSRVWDLTETNFYKAYDECVRLFKGE